MILTANVGLRQKFKFHPIIQCQKHFFSISLKHQNFISLLKSCNQTSEITQIHACTIKTGLHLIPFPLSKLLASCSLLDIDYAASIFNHFHSPNLFMFNTMMRGYSISNNPKQAIFLFNSIRAQGILIDQYSFISTLKSCGREFAVPTGLGIHAVVVRTGHDFFVDLRNTLLNFYCVCGRIDDAQQVFDELPQQRDLVSWNALMGGYLHVSEPAVVMGLFRQMHLSYFEATTTTVLSALSACGDSRSLLGGESLHGHCIKSGFCSDLNVVTAVIAMYAKTGCMDFAWRIFDGLPEKDVVLWNCMIDGYAKNGLLEESLALLQMMKLKQMKPNSATLAGLLSVCAASGALSVGRCIKEYIEEQQLDLDVVLGTALVEMNSKCGSLEEAIDVFVRMKAKDVQSWTAMISGFGVHGQGRNAIRLFYMMEEEGVRPNEVTFLAVLNACSHGGLVTEGKNCFDRMIRKYGFSPMIKHYGCMIDLLGRAGLLEEAYELIKSMPIEADGTAWRALLAACRVHGNIEFGEIVKRELAELNDKHPTDSILLSSTYAVVGRWADVERLRELREEKIVIKKQAGCSSIEMDN